MFVPLLLAGCQETPNETAKDVAAARQDAAKNVTEAREDKAAVVATSNDKVADARQDYAQTDKDALKKLTVAEARNGAEEAKFWDAWESKNKGQTRDKREIKDGAGDGGRPTRTPRRANRPAWA